MNTGDMGDEVEDLERLSRVRELAISGEARMIRENARLSTTDLARAVGVDKSLVSRWERGDRLPWASAAALRYEAILVRLRKMRTTVGAQVVVDGGRKDPA